MSRTDTTPCEVAREFLFVASQSREKATKYPSLATAYWQVALEMQRAVARHAKHCGRCQEEERRLTRSGVRCA